MTTITSRRAVLAGAATLPALALPALALPAMAGQRSDRELAALERELEAAHARMMEASKVSSEVSERYEAMRPRNRRRYHDQRDMRNYGKRSL